jgi:hypothetical protein
VAGRIGYRRRRMNAISDPQTLVAAEAETGFAVGLGYGSGFYLTSGRPGLARRGSDKAPRVGFGA